jgi:hypothetical protein
LVGGLFRGVIRATVWAYRPPLKVFHL